jgi:hypothetical protein
MLRPQHKIKDKRGRASVSRRLYRAEFRASPMSEEDDELDEGDGEEDEGGDDEETEE